MASAVECTFGFELLYKVSSQQISNKEDVLILFVHWYFIKNDFKCLGTGDSKAIADSETGSELLPENWNQTPNYTLRYVKEGKLYILLGIKSEGDLLLNLLRVEDHAVSNVQFSIDIVKELKGLLEVLLPSYDSVITTLKKDLIDPVYSKTAGPQTTQVSTQTAESESNRLGRNDDDDPLRVRAPQRPTIPPMPGLPDPFGVGGYDLDPFGGRGGGGMLMDPFGNRGLRNPYPGLGVPGRLPPGAIPPGARFDPFGPPDVVVPNPRPRMPDADHLPPPGYDDMFM